MSTSVRRLYWSTSLSCLALFLAFQAPVFANAVSPVAFAAERNQESDPSAPARKKKRKKAKAKKEVTSHSQVLPIIIAVPSTVARPVETVVSAPVTPVAPAVISGEESASRSNIRGPRAPKQGINGATAVGLVISKFRVRGPSGSDDEFIEIYNISGADHTVAGGGAGYAVAASDGVARCFIPNGTVIPNRGHYLCVNSDAYSLASYPAGNGTTATGDSAYTADIPDNAGIAIFNTTVPADFTLANRFDAVGSTSEANALYKEGAGYPALTPFSIDYSFYRDNCGKSGSITSSGGCSIDTPKDTNSNAADFVFVDTNGTSAGAGQRLGAPGPENLSSPIQRNASFPAQLLDPCVGGPSPPNRVRDFTSDPGNNSTFGTLDIRRSFTNGTGANVTRLRFRVIDLTTFPAPSGFADLRPRTSTAVVVVVDRAPCGAGTSPVTVQGTTLEQPPGQPNGGGFNSSLSVGIVTLATPLPPGDTIDIRFLLGIQQTGTFRFYVNVEALP